MIYLVIYHVVSFSVPCLGNIKNDKLPFLDYIQYTIREKARKGEMVCHA